jgi:hypothetical protein
MAGLGRKVFAAGEVLTAANVQGYLQDQAVMVFDDATDRATVLGTAVAEGMTTYLKDVNTVQVYDGGVWKVVTSDPSLTSSTATAYTLQTTDAGQYLRFTNFGTVTIGTATGFSEAQSAAIFADGTALIINSQAGVTLAGVGTAGTALRFASGAQYSLIGIVCTSANNYRIIGNVTLA